MPVTLMLQRDDDARRRHHAISGMIPLGVDKSSRILVGVVSECGGIFVVNIVVIGDHM